MKMKIIGLMLLSLAVSVIGQPVYERDSAPSLEHVLALTEANFDATINSTEHVLVEFVAPWCDQCITMFPEYARLAELLFDKKSPIKVATVDCSKELSLAERYSARAYPLFSLFENGQPIASYSGEATHGHILRWIEKKTQPAQLFDTEASLKKFIKKSDVIIMGFFEDVNSRAAKAYKAVARELNDFPCGMVNSTELREQYRALEDTVAVFRTFDDGRKDLTGDLNAENIKWHVNAHVLPIVTKLNMDSAPLIFSGHIENHVLLFMGPNTEGFEDIRANFKAVAAEFKGDVLSIYVDPDDEVNQGMIKYFEFSQTDFPALIFVKAQAIKFQSESRDFSADSIEKFVRDALDNKAKRFIKSEEIPEDWDVAPVKTLVGRNFDEVALDKTKHVFVNFHTKQCVLCKQLDKMWDNLADKYDDKDDIVLAQINVDSNDVDRVKVSTFPMVVYFPKNSDEMIEYDGLFMMEPLDAFIQSGILSETRQEL